MPENAPAPTDGKTARRSRTPGLLAATAAFSATGIGAGLWFFASPTPLSFAVFTTAGEAALLFSGFLYLLIIARDVARRTREKVGGSSGGRPA